MAFAQFPDLFPRTVPDTHDGGAFVLDYRKKKKQADLLAEEIARKAKLRSDLELAIYGPEPEELPAAPQIKAPIMAAPNVEDLTRSIMQARTMEAAAHHRALLQDDEDVLDLIMKDLG